jgi:hypothetical protein
MSASCRLNSRQLLIAKLKLQSTNAILDEPVVCAGNKGCLRLSASVDGLIVSLSAGSDSNDRIVDEFPRLPLPSSRL